MAHFCSNCGNSVRDDMTFCPNCGASVQGGAPVNYNQGYNAPTASWTNGYAIAGFILAFFFALLGLIFSIIGLNKANEHNGSGKGLSIAGIIIATLNMALAVLIVANGGY